MDNPFHHALDSVTNNLNQTRTFNFLQLCAICFTTTVAFFTRFLTFRLYKVAYNFVLIIHNYEIVYGNCPTCCEFNRKML